MGENVEFKCNGSTAAGYLAVPSGGSGPGLLVLQEWWGLVPQIQATVDRLAGEGYVALAPDLYHGETCGWTGGPASHTEMDKAGELMNSLPPDRAARDMGGAVDYLMGHEATTGDNVGVVGFCMGGMLTLLIAAQAGDKIGAAVAFYGAPLGDNAPDWSGLTAPVLAHLAEKDDFFPLDAMQGLFSELQGMGKDVTVHVYPGTGHAFANEENPIGNRDEEAGRLAWERTHEFLRSKLG
jgi:carboxymethylenebutenolidase